jgi:hypothetical protein
MFKTFKSINIYLREYKKLYISAAIMTIGFALLAQVDPYITGKLIDVIIDGGDI